MVRGVSSSEKLFIRETLMVMLAQLERGLRWYMRVFDIVNRTKRQKILNFVVTYDLMVANIFFRKKNSFNYFQRWSTLEPDRFYPY
jgi:hypothetical protein